MSEQKAEKAQAHKCDEQCVCPRHGTALIYAPSIREHACQDIDCDGRPWWVCPLCGFDAKKFEKSPAYQPGAIRYHMALHEAGRVRTPPDSEVVR